VDEEYEWRLRFYLALRRAKKVASILLDSRLFIGKHKLGLRVMTTTNAAKLGRFIDIR
jgi:hypothetical protein